MSSSDVAEEYASSLSDLVANSKPLINMLTMLAEENIDHAPEIVQAVERHLQQDWVEAARAKFPVSSEWEAVFINPFWI